MAGEGGDTSYYNKNPYYNKKQDTVPKLKKLRLLKNKKQIEQENKQKTMF